MHSASADNSTQQRIATLQVVAGTNWQAMPITQLGGLPIHIDFDDMTHDYHRYTYKIEHCDANWKVSEGLFEADYLRGFNGEQAIDNIEQSLQHTTSIHPLSAHHPKRELSHYHERKL